MAVVVSHRTSNGQNRYFLHAFGSNVSEYASLADKPTIAGRTSTALMSVNNIAFLIEIKFSACRRHKIQRERGSFRLMEVRAASKGLADWLNVNNHLSNATHRRCHREKFRHPLRLSRTIPSLVHRGFRPRSVHLRAWRPGAAGLFIRARVRPSVARNSGFVRVRPGPYPFTVAGDHHSPRSSSRLPLDGCGCNGCSMGAVFAAARPSADRHYGCMA